MKDGFRYFAGRNAMDIEGLGERLIEQLVRRTAWCAATATFIAFRSTN